MTDNWGQTVKRTGKKQQNCSCCKTLSETDPKTKQVKQLATSDRLTPDKFQQLLEYINYHRELVRTLILLS